MKGATRTHADVNRTSVGIFVMASGVLTFLTAITFVTGQAEADVGVGLVDAGASVFTGIRLAVVHIWEEEQEA